MFPRRKRANGREIDFIAEIKHVVMNEHTVLHNAPYFLSEEDLIGRGLVVNNALPFLQPLLNELPQGRQRTPCSTPKPGKNKLRMRIEIAHYMKMPV